MLGSFASRSGAQPLDCLCQLGQYGAAAEFGDRQLDPELDLDAVQHPKDRDRITAQIEEIGFALGRGYLQHVAP